MVESHLVAGRQDLIPGQPLIFGQSITDGCIDWDSSVQVLERLALAVRRRRLIARNEHGRRSDAAAVMLANH
jgi:3-deoxy-7-phosphoheptulonate synthase